ncbi:HTH_Tnp_Tc3_2 domain-containing protein [Trichonephila clavipes]|nr:HTH_Tnp_Tc3_2 domain-containing protein [Trichonephila clavipes]
MINLSAHSYKANDGNDVYNVLKCGNCSAGFSFIHKLHLNVVARRKNAMMPRVRSRNAYLQVSDFDKGRIVAYRDCGLSYRNIAARVERDPMTVSRKGNRWFQDGNTERRAGSQRLPLNSSREDRQVTRIALTHLCRWLKYKPTSQPFCRQISAGVTNWMF